MLLRSFLAFALSVTSAAALAASTTTVMPAGGGKATTITVDGAKVDIAVGDQHLVGTAKGDKRQYTHAGGDAFVEVKSGENGFKLRKADGRLAWKVKIADDKIKVSDNEENAHPWTIKTKYADKVKVEDPAEKDAGEVKFADSGKIKVKDAAEVEPWVVKSGSKSAAYGVLLMSGVPADYASVIMAELLARNL